MSEQGSVGIVETKSFTFGETPDEMVLDCGRKLGPITLAYETYGELNEDKSNAILLLHALSGDAHVAGRHSMDDRKSGWWDSMVGPGKGFDTSKYFVICSNVLGGCSGSTGPASINPATGKQYALTFPIITIEDMVRAQRHLIEHLGIEKLLSVAGGSMGGMQALAWMLHYPDMVQSAMIIASTHVSSAQSIAFDAVGRHAIQADPAFEKGNYYGKGEPAQGLSIARMVGHITYLSDESMHAKFGRTLRHTEELSYDFASEFAVETYLDHQGELFVNRFDANSYLYMTKALDYFDVSVAFGSLDKAMAGATSKVLALSYTSDWLFPPYQSQEIVDALTRNKRSVTYCNIKSNYGHDSFLLETDVMEEIISGFLAHADTEPAQTPVPPAPKSTGKAHANIYEGERFDYDLIVDLVEKGSRVLDIGCGDGVLLAQLAAEKQIDAMGLELNQDNIVRCIERGLPVAQANVDHGLASFPDRSYDYVVLSMTLQVIKNPDRVLREILRVGRKCIISFPNCGFWKVRAKLMFLGSAPVTRNLPYQWHSSPNRHMLSIKDFRAFCKERGARIEKELLLSTHGKVWSARMWPNLLADEAVFVISSE